MRKFNIKVNGTNYEVEVEEVGGNGQSVAPAQRPTVVKAAESQVKTAPIATAASSGASVSAPMPGTILDIKVAEGDTVKKGQVLLILEAMKMENEITAPSSGVIGKIAVAKGASVVTHDVLVTFA